MTIRARLLAWMETRNKFTRAEAVRRFTSIKPGTIDLYLHELKVAGYLSAVQVITKHEQSCWQRRIYSRTGKPLESFRFKPGSHRRSRQHENKRTPTVSRPRAD